MASLNDAMVSIESYSRNHRHPQKDPLDVSGLYDLFPDHPIQIETTPSGKWPEPYPYGDRRGVYVILDEHLDIRYVGKASMSNILAARLSSYFGYGEQRKCRVFHDNWKVKPRFLMTVAVPDDSGFEAPSLEEFLIRELKPGDNSIGR